MLPRPRPHQHDGRWRSNTMAGQPAPTRNKPGAHGGNTTMKGPLDSRINRLEAAFADPRDRTPKRVIRIVTSDQEEEAALELAKAEGWDPEGDDICVIRLVKLTAARKEVAPAGSGQPCVLSKNW